MDDRPSNPSRPTHADRSVLQCVLGVLQRSEHAVAVHLQLTAVRLDQRCECITVASLRPPEQFGLS
jgi:hypothetical protein